MTDNTNSQSSGNGTQFWFQGINYKLEMDTAGRYHAYPISPIAETPQPPELYDNTRIDGNPIIDINWIITDEFKTIRDMAAKIFYAKSLLKGVVNYINDYDKGKRKFIALEFISNEIRHVLKKLEE